MAQFDNRAAVTIGGERHEAAASNGACQIYFDEFSGKAEEPYTGRLRSDVLRVYQQYTTALGYDPDEPGTRLVGEDGEPVEGHVPGYEEIPQIVAIAWAMIRAAGSTRLGWDAFRKRFYEASSARSEFRELYAALVIDLAQRAFFHEPQGQPDAQ